VHEESWETEQILRSAKIFVRTEFYLMLARCATFYSHFLNKREQDFLPLYEAMNHCDELYA